MAVVVVIGERRTGRIGHRNASRCGFVAEMTPTDVDEELGRSSEPGQKEVGTTVAVDVAPGGAVQELTAGWSRHGRPHPGVIRNVAELRDDDRCLRYGEVEWSAARSPYASSPRWQCAPGKT